VPAGPLVLYATVSGNAEQLAHAAGEALRADGFAPAVRNMADFPAAGLREWDVVLVVASTWGDGEPPPDAAEFAAALAAAPAGSLASVRHAVLALGSSMYPGFCAFGRRLDADLARAGARDLVPRVECDTRFKAGYERWLADVRAALRRPD
jgi:sulfite reductase (NADPH) flavoprotein alpha-component